MAHVRTVQWRMPRLRLPLLPSCPKCRRPLASHFLLPCGLAFCSRNPVTRPLLQGRGITGATRTSQNSSARLLASSLASIWFSRLAITDLCSPPHQRRRYVRNGTKLLWTTSRAARLALTADAIVCPAPVRSAGCSGVVTTGRECRGQPIDASCACNQPLSPRSCCRARHS